MLLPGLPLSTLKRNRKRCIARAEAERSSRPRLYWAGTFTSPVAIFPLTGS
jgi:hypothetical protein